MLVFPIFTLSKHILNVLIYGKRDYHEHLRRLCTLVRWMSSPRHMRQTLYSSRQLIDSKALVSTLRIRCGDPSINKTTHMFHVLVALFYLQNKIIFNINVVDRFFFLLEED